jgi:hypothetical protein
MVYEIFLLSLTRYKFTLRARTKVARVLNVWVIHLIA